ncbi:MAG: phosphoribosylaminoimidazolesuccinocarboxamide synthase [Nitrospinota bacterium]
MEKREKLYEGKAKILYATDDPSLLIQHFKDDATAFNALKRGTIEGKGVLNNRISDRLFRHLEEKGVPTHYVGTLSDREMVVKRLQMIPVEVVVRNVVAGSLAKRLGKPEGEELPCPKVEFYYKNDALGDPEVNVERILASGWANGREMEEIRHRALEVNAILQEFFDERGILLVDFKVEFGRYRTRGGGEGTAERLPPFYDRVELLLGDEITPDTCRLWDSETRRVLDKDRFRRDLGGVEEAYQEVCQRVLG